jgi:hypothetical protein
MGISLTLPVFICIEVTFYRYEGKLAFKPAKSVRETVREKPAKIG